MEKEQDDNMVAGSSCLTFEAELAPYLEGEERPQLLAHARQCDFCRCVLADLQQIRMLSSEIELQDPPAAVWTRLRATLVAEGVIKTQPGFWNRWSVLRAPLPVGALAAAAIVAIVLLKSPGRLFQTHAPAVRTIHGMAIQEYMPPADFAQLKHTIQQLQVAYNANESLLEPSTKETYRKSLASLNDEIQECEVSIQQDPQNGLARQYLSTAYTQKAQLLQSALEFDLH